jgi:hypothetical protein
MRYEAIKEIETLVDAFERVEISRQEWTHRAYLTVTLYYCSRYPLRSATARMRYGIMRLNEKNGVANTATSGYHETMTVFWTITVRDFLKASRHRDLVGLANELITSYGDPRLPLGYYSRSVLFSPEARRCYIRPDLGMFYKLVARVDESRQLQFA